MALGSNLPAGSLGGGLIAIILGMLVVFLIIAVIVWIYMSFAFMAIAKKAKQDMPGLAWIPGVGPLIIAFRSANMHWWPWLLLIGYFIPFVNFLVMIVFLVYTFIWQWKLFEVIGKPGWWPLLSIIPFLGPIIYLILVGVAAWSKD